ncbi:hypothetical protein [Ruegeria sp. HKCCE4150]|uniref:hypothetical protein n=1 Tax=Ruegeria sp. HKCCE4150 TaxID=2794828 RepID=UPI001AE37105|nr:hypothetical protein [Ruegeria sp. HKCCE4150]
MSLEEAAQRGIENLFERPEGPLAFRIVLQPIAAAVLGVRDGLRDARSGAQPYGLALSLKTSHRREAWRGGFIATARVMIVALLIDVAYQLWFLQALYPGEALVVAFVIGFLPYLLVRGPASRIARIFNTPADDPPD